MSSYLTIQAIPKEGGEVLLSVVSRSSELYQLFYEHNLAPYGSENRRELSQEDLTNLLVELREEIDSDEARTELLHTRSITASRTDDEDPIDEYLRWKKYVEDKMELFHDIRFLENLIEINSSYNKVTVYCYID